MINILVFGDSNSWGYTDEDEGKRYDKRWPIELSNNLANALLNCSVKEDSLPGRTTNVNDMQDGSHLNGASIFKSCLLSHSPLDLIIIMLGTNDLKKRFNRSSDEVAKGVKELINIAKHTFSGKGTWHDQNLSEIVVICPPVLGELSNDLQWSNYIEWDGAFDKSKKLFYSLKHVTDEEKIYLIDSDGELIIEKNEEEMIKNQRLILSGYESDLNLSSIISNLNIHYPDILSLVKEMEFIERRR